MKKITYSAILLTSFFIMSCDKTTVDMPTFEVSTDKTTYNVNDSIDFNFSGEQPNNIVFYSGETGNDYSASSVFTASQGAPEMTLTTAVTSLTGSSTNTNLSLLVSSNFSGNYTTTDIKAATWTDITNLITVPGVNQNVKLSSFKVDEKPLYIAFRFKTLDSTLSQRQITISNFSFKTIYPTQTFVNAINVYDAGFGPFDLAGSVGKWVIPISSATNTSFIHPSVPAGSSSDDDWAISKPLSTNSILPSKGVSIKAIADAPLKSFRYKFATPGSYKVVFVARNIFSGDIREVVKELNLTIN